MSAKPTSTNRVSSKLKPAWSVRVRDLEGNLPAGSRIVSARLDPRNDRPITASPGYSFPSNTGSQTGTPQSP